MNLPQDADLLLGALRDLAVPVVLLDDAGRVLFMNSAAEILTRLTQEKSCGNVLPLRKPLRLEAGTAQVLDAGDGAWTAEARIAKIESAGRAIYAVCLQDGMERGRLQAALRAAMLIDNATGLLNRRGFLLLTQHQLKVAKRTQRGLFVILVQLDGVGEQVERLGQRVVERAALEIAEALRKDFRDSDILGRMSDEQFAVTAIDAAFESRALLLDRFRRTLGWRQGAEGDACPYEVLLGAARFDPFSPYTIDELLARAQASLGTSVEPEAVPS